MNTETIFSSYQPVEQYLQAVRSAHGLTPAVPIKPLDAFLMRQMAALYPTAPIIVDLAGAATLGASTVLWLNAVPGIQQFYAATTTWDVPGDGDWRKLVQDSPSTPRALTIPDKPLDRAGGWEAIAKTFNSLAPLFVTLALPDGTPQALSERLKWALGLHPNVVLLVLPLGKTGDSALLEAALSICTLTAPHRLNVLREVSPFFGTSQLGLIARRDNDAIAPILERLRTLYDGNFNYLALAEANVKMHLQSTQIQTVAITQVASGGAPAPAASEEPAGPVPLPQLATRRAKSLAKRLLGMQSIDHRLHYVKAMLPKQMQTGETYDCTIRVRNDDPKPWYTPEQSKNSVNISYHWRSEKGEMLVKEGLRSPLLAAVFPGETATLPFKITMPGQPGRYQLEIDFVHEGVAWFSDCGAPGPVFAVEVVA